MIAGGSILASSGALVLLSNTPGGTNNAIAYGLVSVAGGATLLGFGIRRRVGWSRWRLGDPARLSVVPLPQGGMLGLSGRF